MQQWRDCCFNPPLFDHFGSPHNLGRAQLHKISADVNGYALRHNGDSALLRSLLKPSGAEPWSDFAHQQ